MTKSSVGSVGDGYLPLPGVADPVNKRSHPARSLERSGLLSETRLEQTSQYYSEWKPAQSLECCTMFVYFEVCCASFQHLSGRVISLHEQTLAGTLWWYAWTRIFKSHTVSDHLCCFRFGLTQLHRSSSLWVQALVFSWPSPATIHFITTATSTPGSHLQTLSCCFTHFEVQMRPL